MPVSRSTLRRSCQTASDRCQAARRPHRREREAPVPPCCFLPMGCYTRSGGTLPIEPTPNRPRHVRGLPQSDGIILMGADPHRRHARASTLTDDRNTRRSQHPSAARERQRHRRLPRRCRGPNPDQYTLSYNPINQPSARPVRRTAHPPAMG